MATQASILLGYESVKIIVFKWKKYESNWLEQKGAFICFFNVDFLIKKFILNYS